MTAASTRIDMSDLPNFPGVVAYQITAPTCAEVQVAISRIMTRTSIVGGIAEFRNPYRAGAEWLSRGYVKEATSAEETETQDQRQVGA